MATWRRQRFGFETVCSESKLSTGKNEPVDFMILASDKAAMAQAQMVNVVQTNEARMSNSMGS